MGIGDLEGAVGAELGVPTRLVEPMVMMRADEDQVGQLWSSMTDSAPCAPLPRRFASSRFRPGDPVRSVAWTSRG